MKKHLIIGRPIGHSLSPKIHSYWFGINKIDAIYEKLSLEDSDLENTIKLIKTGDIFGMNVTVPFKQKVIPFLDDMSNLSKETFSVNTIFNKDGKIFGDNTDVYGFEKSIIEHNLDLKDKSVLIFGAGGVVPSIITALNNLKVKKIFLSNRTYKNAESVKKRYQNIEILKWGEFIDCDIYVNSTSVGLNQNDDLKFNFSALSEKKIFYDVIYNPIKTKFLKDADKLRHKTINGRDMFLYQAQKAFHLWHNISPKIDEKLINYLFND